MATLYDWTDQDGDKGSVKDVFSDEEGVAYLEVNNHPGVFLTRLQAKELRKVLKRALAGV